MGDKLTLRLGSLGGDFQVIDPVSMTKITGGRNLDIRPISTSSCGGIMPS